MEAVEAGLKAGEKVGAVGGGGRGGERSAGAGSLGVGVELDRNVWEAFTGVVAAAVDAVVEPDVVPDGAEGGCVLVHAQVPGLIDFVGLEIGDGEDGGAEATHSGGGAVAVIGIGGGVSGGGAEGGWGEDDREVVAGRHGGEKVVAAAGGDGKADKGVGVRIRGVVTIVAVEFYADAVDAGFVGVLDAVAVEVIPDAVTVGDGDDGLNGDANFDGFCGGERLVGVGEGG